MFVNINDILDPLILTNISNGCNSYHQILDHVKKI